MPATATAQVGCHAPKGWSTASAQFSYEIAREQAIMDGQNAAALDQSGLSSNPSAWFAARPGALALWLGQKPASASALGSALSRYASAMVTTTVADPPGCGTPRKRARTRR